MSGYEKGDLYNTEGLKEMRSRMFADLLAEHFNAIEDAIAGLLINGVDPNQISLMRDVNRQGISTVLMVDFVPKYSFRVTFHSEGA